MTNPRSGGLMDIVGQLIGAAAQGGSAQPQPSTPGGTLSEMIGEALGGGSAQQQPSGSGDVLGQILGGALGGGQQQPGASGDVLGQILGGALGGGQQPGASGGVLGQILGGVLGGGQPNMPGMGADPGLGGMTGALGGGPMTQMLLNALGPTLAQYVADTFGIDKRTAMQVLMIAIPLLLTALARNTQNKRGAGSLHSALERDHDGSALNNLGGIFADPSSAKGDKIVKKVLGSQTDAVAQTLTEQTGLDGGQLLSALAPVVLGVLGQQQRAQGLDPNGLAGALNQERSALESSSGDLMSALTQVIGS